MEGRNTVYSNPPAPIVYFQRTDFKYIYLFWKNEFKWSAKKSFMLYSFIPFLLMSYKVLHKKCYHTTIQYVFAFFLKKGLSKKNKKKMLTT